MISVVITVSPAINIMRQTLASTVDTGLLSFKLYAFTLLRFYAFAIKFLDTSKSSLPKCVKYNECNY